MIVSTVANKVMFTFAVLTLGFVAGSYANKPVMAAAPVTHVVGGNVLNDAQFKELMTLQNAANEELQQQYAASLVINQAKDDADEQKMLAMVAKKAQKNHGTYVGLGSIKYNVAL